ncbi:hypothetical protein HDU79_008319 [Rhizoclosmatium sp. JEL0117]|nr:hypothetical protein HDU79_008319 [Rhizoclosmatium sp. JEL0117]
MYFIVLLLVVTVVTVSVDDCQVLYAAYPSLIPATCCGLNKGTTSDGDPSVKVNCDASNHITWLELNRNPLQGQALVDFGSFTKLSYLSLYKNGGITGSLPRSFPSTLTYIGILENVNGPIPMLPPNLLTLYIESPSRGLSGPLPQLPTTLTFLQLIGGYMTGSLPDILPLGLTKYGLVNLGLTGTIPNNVAKFGNSLELDGNCFSNAASFSIVVNNCSAIISTSPSTTYLAIQTGFSVATNPVPIATSTASAVVLKLENTSGSGSANVGLIAGILCGIVALAGAAIAYFCWTRKRGSKDAEQGTVKEEEPFLSANDVATVTPTNRSQPGDDSTLIDAGSRQSLVETNSSSAPSISSTNTIPISLDKKTAELFNSMSSLAASTPLDVGKMAETSVSPENVFAWSVEETAAWIAQNGGWEDGGKRASIQLIDGNALIVAEDPKDILDIVQCETYRERMRLKNSLISLKESYFASQAPPPFTE